MAFEKEVQNFTAEGTDLPESKLSTGFLPGEKPPANWFNSLIYRLSQATRELQEKAVEKEYVDEQINATGGNIDKKAETVTYTAVIPSVGWNAEAPDYVEGAVAGVLETDNPIVTPIYTGTVETDQLIKESWNKIDRGISNVDSIKFYAFEEIPVNEIPVQIQIVR